VGLDGPDNVLFRTKNSSSDIVIADFGMRVSLTCSLENVSRKSFDLAGPSTSNPLNSSPRPSQAVWDMCLRRCSTKGARKARRPLVNGTVACCRPFVPRWNADYSLQVHYLYAPLRIYTFQIMIRRHKRSHTTNDRSEDQLSRSILEERVRRRFVLDHIQIRLSDFYTQQRRASFAPCSIQTRHVALQPSKRSRIRSSQASPHQPNTSTVETHVTPVMLRSSTLRHVISDIRIFTYFSRLFLSFPSVCFDHLELRVSLSYHIATLFSSLL
jgi:hypothetical protein